MISVIIHKRRKLRYHFLMISSKSHLSSSLSHLHFHKITRPLPAFNAEITNRFEMQFAVRLSSVFYHETSPEFFSFVLQLFLAVFVTQIFSNALDQNSTLFSLGFVRCLPYDVNKLPGCNLILLLSVLFLNCSHFQHRCLRFKQNLHFPLYVFQYVLVSVCTSPSPLQNRNVLSVICNFLNQK